MHKSYMHLCNFIRKLIDRLYTQVYKGFDSVSYVSRRFSFVLSFLSPCLAVETLQKPSRHFSLAECVVVVSGRLTSVCCTNSPEMAQEEQEEVFGTGYAVARCGGLKDVGHWLPVLDTHYSRQHKFGGGKRAVDLPTQQVRGITLVHRKRLFLLILVALINMRNVTSILPNNQTFMDKLCRSRHQLPRKDQGLKQLKDMIA
ncbi:hypothetical protein K435DRAFT_843531 [Dendrothele bispora CBS 962.96]|uniref:Uncharacterized protein n=1 Tax=Dendrothele bispora (strain CBS 962.96) TaxID=1314807 RepID=A0A4S8L8A6_DENBC|nr:hypothetical protein K435DRAFT_843531 [Dendrothele bispora CBS 962.96]